MILTRFYSLSSAFNIVLATLLVLVASSCSKKSSSLSNTSSKTESGILHHINPELHPNNFIPNMHDVVADACAEFQKKDGIGQQLNQCINPIYEIHDEALAEGVGLPRGSDTTLAREKIELLHNLYLLMWSLCAAEAPIYKDYVDTRELSEWLAGEEVATHVTYNQFFQIKDLGLCDFPCADLFNNEAVFRLLRYRLNYLEHVHARKTEYPSVKPGHATRS